MDISVLGVDLGKNVCSVVGLDASGAVVLRAAGKAPNADRIGCETSALRGRDGSVLRGLISVASSPVNPTAAIIDSQSLKAAERGEPRAGVKRTQRVTTPARTRR